MKAIKIITHPYLLIASFLCIIISGEHVGGFYAMYLLTALFHLGIHALLATAGIVLLAASHIMYKRQRKYLIETIMNIAGVLCLFLSLFFFFYNDVKQYNYGTFEQTVPQLTMILFGILSIGFIVSNFMKASDRQTSSHLSMR